MAGAAGGGTFSWTYWPFVNGQFQSGNLIWSLLGAMILLMLTAKLDLSAYALKGTQRNRYDATKAARSPPVPDLRRPKSCVNCKRLNRPSWRMGRVDGPELEAACARRLYAGGKIERPGADFLVELHKRVQHRTPAFDQFFYRGIKNHILAYGQISARGSGLAAAGALRRRQDRRRGAQVPARTQGRGQAGQPGV